jgi:hypothetical protein
MDSIAKLVRIRASAGLALGAQRETPALIISRHRLVSGATPSISLTLRQAYEIRNLDGERVVCRGFLP